MKSIAIDGPSGAGKSTVARILSKEFGFIYLDTGALYRAISWKFLKNDIAVDMDDKLLEVIDKTTVNVKFVDGLQRIFIDNQDITDEIRTPEISMAASDFSSKSIVREYLLQNQREISLKNDVIMDGRDIGTVVMPDADLKIYLTADISDRAKRRYDELLQRGMTVTFSDVKNDMEVRDHNDQNRKSAPLRPAKDAIIVDTTGNSLDQTVEAIRKIVKDRLF